MNHRRRLAIVIGSGGLKCAAVIGVIQVLEEENIAIDMIVGCSGGSVFGAGIALGFSAEIMTEIRSQFWTSDVSRKLDIRSLFKIIFPGLFGFNDQIGVFDDSVFVGNLKSCFGATTTFADTKIPFHCVATDFHTGQPVVISEGSIAKAVRISSGIPIIFKPVEWNGKLLIDGALSNPLPVDVAIKEGAEIIIAVGFETPLLPSVTSPGNYARQMFNILINQLLYKKFAFYNLAHHSEIILIMPEIKGVIKIGDVNSVPYIIEQGKEETRKHLEYLKQLLDSPTT